MPSSSAIITAAFSPMTSAVEYVFAATLPGPMDKSATFSPWTPYTFRRESTTPPRARGFIAHVPSCKSRRKKKHGFISLYVATSTGKKLSQRARSYALETVRYHQDTRHTNNDKVSLTRCARIRLKRALVLVLVLNSRHI